MKIVQSFWSKPFLHSDKTLLDARLNGGWPHRKLNYYSWALSCLQLRKYYDNVELVTDRLGKEIFIDKLQLPYTHVRVVLNELDHYDAGLWALGKLYSYGIQTEPFLHVDGDVFIWKAFGGEITEAPLIAQNLEANSPGYGGVYKDIWHKFTYLPVCFKGIRDLEFSPGCNAGILGGNDIGFLQRYVKEAFFFLEQNMPAIVPSILNINAGHMNVIFEQLIFYFLARQCGLPVTYLFPEAKEIPPEIGFFHTSLQNKNYVHCFGPYKTFRVVYSFLEWKLKADYPQYYHRIAGLVSASEI